MADLWPQQATRPPIVGPRHTIPAAHLPGRDLILAQMRSANEDLGDAWEIAEVLTRSSLSPDVLDEMERAAFGFARRYPAARRMRYCQHCPGRCAG